MKRPVIIFCLIEWEAPLLHRNHMLARYLARQGHPVHFIEKKILKPENMGGYFTPRVLQVGKNITVHQLPRIPYCKGIFKALYYINDHQPVAYLDKLAAELKDKDPVIIVEYPLWIKAILHSKLNNCTLCYDISDDFELFKIHPALKKQLGIYEKIAVDHADHIVVTSPNLRDKIHRLAGESGLKNVSLVENGVDIKEFDLVQEETEDVFKDIPRPVIGFIGGIFSWINLNLIKRSAQTYPNYSFVLIGPTDRMQEVKELQEIPNIYYLGIKPKEEIARYFKYLDVGLIPFVSEQEDERLKTVNSNKVFQYMYFGYPVVATSYEQVRAIKDIAYIAYTDDEFIDNINKAVLEADPGKKQIRQEFAHKHSWEEVVDSLVKIIM